MNNFWEVSFSAVFDRTKDYFSELLYTQSIFSCERHFLVPGVKRESKRGSTFAISNKMITRTKSLHTCIILHEEFDCGIYFCRATCFDMFWGTLGVSGGAKRLKILHPSKNDSQKHRDIIFDHRFYTVTYLGQITTKFWPFLGQARGQKGSKIGLFSKSNPAETPNLYRELIFHQWFDTAPHLGQIRDADSFWGHPGCQVGVQKDKKNCILR